MAQIDSLRTLETELGQEWAFGSEYVLFLKTLQNLGIQYSLVEPTEDLQQQLSVAGYQDIPFFSCEIVRVGMIDLIFGNSESNENGPFLFMKKGKNIKPRIFYDPVNNSFDSSIRGPLAIEQAEDDTTLYSLPQTSQTELDIFVRVLQVLGIEHSVFDMNKYLDIVGRWLKAIGVVILDQDFFFSREQIVWSEGQGYGPHDIFVNHTQKAVSCDAVPRRLYNYNYPAGFNTGYTVIGALVRRYPNYNWPVGLLEPPVEKMELERFMEVLEDLGIPYNCLKAESDEWDALLKKSGLGITAEDCNVIEVGENKYLFLTQTPLRGIDDKSLIGVYLMTKTAGGKVQPRTTFFGIKFKTNTIPVIERTTGKNTIENINKTHPNIKIWE